MTLPSHALPEAMPSVAVFEQRPWWTPELQRQFHDEPIVVRGSRSVADALQADVAVLQLDAAPVDVLYNLERRMAMGGSRSAIVVAALEWEILEWTVRELGADAFVGEQLAGENLARLCRRQLNRVREQTWLIRV